MVDSEDTDRTSMNNKVHTVGKPPEIGSTNIEMNNLIVLGALFDRTENPVGLLDELHAKTFASLLVPMGSLSKLVFRL